MVAQASTSSSSLVSAHSLAEWRGVLERAAARNQTIIALFTASWCAACKKVVPDFVALSADFPHVRFVTVVVDQNEETGLENGVRKLPTFKAFRNKADAGFVVEGADMEAVRRLVTQEGGDAVAAAAAGASKEGGAPAADEPPEVWLATLPEPELVSLRALAVSDRGALTQRLKAAGFAKMGHRLKLEATLKQQASAALAARGGGGADASTAAAPEVPLVLDERGLPQPVAFSAAAHFSGARRGTVFRMGAQGLGYYRDAPPDMSKEARLARKLKGNTAWLREETMPEEPAPAPAPPPAAAPAAPEPSTALSNPSAPNPFGYRGTLSEARRAKLALEAGPFAPPLHDGKYAEIGHMVKVTGGRYKGWGQVVRMHCGSYYVKMESGETEPCHFSDILTTELIPKHFEIARQAWLKRAPVAKRTLARDAKGQVHKLVPPAAAGTLRLTHRPAEVTGRAQAGSGSGYYYAAVTSDKQSMPLAPPQKINAASVGPLSEGSGLSEPAEPKSSYYYAHRRKIDFHIPTPTPQRLEPVSAD
jgi:thioredoxin 1